jgi:serine protease AprX
MTITLLMSVISPLAGSTDVRGPGHVRDDVALTEGTVLQHGLGIIMEDADDEASFEIIVQFDDRITDPERRSLEALGFEIYRSIPLFDALYMAGPKASILDLADRDDVEYIEYNAPLRPMMNVSADTIAATDVWNRIVLRDDSEDVIDGSGVTVVVLDSGIDATHPDLRYTPVANIENDAPDPGDKVIYNAKKDQDVAGEPWVPFIDTDTTSGHGTHCAGTVGGTGAASGGGKAGIAPGAWLIGLSMGELFMTIDEYSGLEWVYDHSKPGDNPANIRVVTNSWGPGWPFDALDPNALSSQMIDLIVTENNVAVIFAAGNDGSGNHDGADDTVNIFAKVPVATGVAATTRNGKGLASFTSRGDATMNETWPDIGAPGVGIWSAAARVTMIGAGLMGSDIISNDKTDPYYLAISGTSMATPHVAGLVALLWQACPSLTLSDVIEEGHTVGEDDLSPYIHETELILKATAEYVVADGENGVPNETEYGILDKPYDYAQGYGLVNAEKAVGLALMLDKMRDPDHDGDVENEDVTVFDALRKYEGRMTEKDVTMELNVITTSWSGQYVSPWNVVDDNLNASAPLFGRRVPYTSPVHTLFIPDEAATLHITMDIIQVTEDVTFADLYVVIDVNGDGEADWSPDGEPGINYDPSKEWYVDISSGFMAGRRGDNWSFNVSGYALGLSLDGVLGAHYDVGVGVILDSRQDPRVEFPEYRFGEKTSDYPGGTTTLHLYYYDLRSPPGPEKETTLDMVIDMLPLIIGLIAIGGVAYYILNKRRGTGD